MCCSSHRERKQNTEKGETKSSVSKEGKPSEKSKTSVPASQSSNSSSISSKLNKQRNCIEKKHQNRASESQKDRGSRKCHGSGSKRTSQEEGPQAKESNCKERASKDSRKAPEKQCSRVADKDSFPKKEKPKDASKQRDPKTVTELKEKLAVRSKAELPGDEEFEPPTMSFESYLNYDQVTKKRKRKAGSTGERPGKCSEQKSSSLPQKTSAFSHANEGGEKVRNSEDDQSETPSKKVNHCAVEMKVDKTADKEVFQSLTFTEIQLCLFQEQIVWL